MVFVPGRIFPRFSGLFLLLFASSGCSDAITDPPKALEPLVGAWDARVLEVPDPANFLETLDVIQEGGSYALSVLGDGTYSAVFDLVVFQGMEVGTITVSGQTLTLTPAGSSGGAMTGSFMLEGDVLKVDALREIDFDGDGTEELVPFYLELVSRGKF